MASAVCVDTSWRASKTTLQHVVRKFAVEAVDRCGGSGAADVMTRTLTLLPRSLYVNAGTRPSGSSDVPKSG